MIVVTTESIAAKRIVKTLGLVRGNTVRARQIGKDILAGLRNIVGGEIHEYAKLVAESREQSLDRMVKEAEELGSGYRIAMKDLEIRGAGNILGKEQAGTVNAIGLNLYCQMLAESVEKLKTVIQ